jgi:hypothetical protein
MLTRSMAAQMRFGRRYGKRWKSEPVGNRWGYDSWGSAKRPPIMGPMMVPMLQTKGTARLVGAN